MAGSKYKIPLLFFPLHSPSDDLYFPNGVQIIVEVKKSGGYRVTAIAPNGNVMSNWDAKGIYELETVIDHCYKLYGDI